MDIDPLISLKRLIFNNPAARGLEVFRQSRDVIDQKGRMGLAVPAEESTSTPRCTFNAPASNQQPPRLARSGRFFPFGNAKQAGIERAGLIFAACRHGELDMSRGPAAPYSQPWLERARRSSACAASISRTLATRSPPAPRPARRGLRARWCCPRSRRTGACLRSGP